MAKEKGQKDKKNILISLHRIYGIGIVKQCTNSIFINMRYNNSKQDHAKNVDI